MTEMAIFDDRAHGADVEKTYTYCTNWYVPTEALPGIGKQCPNSLFHSFCWNLLEQVCFNSLVHILSAAFHCNTNTVET